jgi:hypothetical protein
MPSFAQRVSIKARTLLSPVSTFGRLGTGCGRRNATTFDVSGAGQEGGPIVSRRRDMKRLNGTTLGGSGARFRLAVAGLLARPGGLRAVMSPPRR